MIEKNRNTVGVFLMFPNNILKLNDLLVRVQGLIEGILGHQHSWKVLCEHVPLIVFYLRKKLQFALRWP